MWGPKAALSAIGWLRAGKSLREYLRWLVDAGLGERLTFPFGALRAFGRILH